MSSLGMSSGEKVDTVLERTNRALRMLSACNEAILHAEDEPALLKSICQLLVERGGYHMAWVGFPEQDEKETTTVRPVAQYGHVEGFLTEVKCSWKEAQQTLDLTGTAIRSETYQICRNITNDHTLTSWREAALKRDYLSCIALPLKNRGPTLGVLTIFASVPDAFNETEIMLLCDLVRDVAFGMEFRRIVSEHEKISAENERYKQILKRSLEGSIKSIASNVEKRQSAMVGYEGQSSQTYAALAGLIARELALPEETIHNIELAAWIHDVGNIALPSEILNKPSKLTDNELALVKNHTRIGYDLLKSLNLPGLIATFVWQHHERLGGSGYPKGLMGDQILLESRILAVADVVESMLTNRPYRHAPGIRQALQEIEQGKGTLYDASVVDACKKLITEKQFPFSVEPPQHTTQLAPDNRVKTKTSGLSNSSAEEMHILAIAKIIPDQGFVSVVLRDGNMIEGIIRRKEQGSYELPDGWHIYGKCEIETKDGPLLIVDYRDIVNRP